MPIGAARCTSLSLLRRLRAARGSITLSVADGGGDDGGVDTDRLVQQFIARTLPKTEWTHHAHLRVGLWHALRHPDDVALNLLRERIRAYNEATGVANTSS